jgi:hypothetical protein
MNNKYIYHSKISEAKTRQIIYLFSLDLNATTIAEITKISRNSINSLLAKFRERFL